MKKHDTLQWWTITALLTAAVVFFVLCSIFVFNGKGMNEGGLIFPQALKVELAPDAITTPDAIPTKEILRRSYEMNRQLYIQAIESSQGGNQLRLLFSAGTWHDPGNVITYVGSALAVILLFYLLRYMARRKWWSRIWTERHLEGKLHYLIPIFLLALFLLAFLNPSIPFNKDYRGKADPLFCLVGMASVAFSAFALTRTARMTRNERFTSASRAIRKSHRRDTLLWAALAGWSLAFLCYFIGMYTIGAQKSLLANILRPALSATKMFVLADSPGDLSYVLRQSGAFMGFYSFTKLYVIIITSISVLSLTWYRISNHFKLKWASPAVKRAYLFWGVSPDTLQLAGSVRNHHIENDDQDCLMLFIDCKENAGEAFAQAPTVQKLFGMFSHNREAFEAVEELDAHILIINEEISGQECSDLIKSGAPTGGNAWKDLKLAKVREIVCHAEETHIFFLDEDENKNIQGAFNLAELLRMTDSLKKALLYCRARRDGMGRTLLSVADTFPDKRVEVRVLDTSMLAVKTLVRSGDSRYHPVHYTDKVDCQTASVGSPFNSCVIGFGETGQDMVSFLYEFSAFLDSRCAGEGSTETYRSPFHCDIYDRYAPELREQFMVRAPGVVGAHNNKVDALGKALPDPDDPMLRFHKGLPFHDSDEAGKTPDLSRMNYIVICLGNDELNMSMLSLLMDSLVKARKGRMSHLLVLVRNYSKANEEAMRRLQDHYNSLYGDEARGVVRIFGQKSAVYTYGVIVNDEITAYARKFYDYYRGIEGSDITWDQRHIQRTERTRLENENSIRRKEGQDVENYIHAGTKLRLMGIGPEGTGSEEGRRLIEDCNTDIRFGTGKDGIMTVILGGHRQILTNLARTEHLRWIASHEAMGYTSNEGVGCDEMAKTHNCLVSWEQLVEVSRRHNEQEKSRNRGRRYQLDFRTFDYIVVKATLEIALEKIRRISSDTGGVTATGNQ